MKLIKLTDFYPDYVKQVYEKNPDLSKKSYEEQKSVFDFDGFGWADFWSHSLNPLGYEVFEVTVNIEPLQRAWARENGIQDPDRCHINDIAVAQIKRFRPDILWFEAAFDHILEGVKELLPTVRLVLGWSGSAIPRTKIWRYIDLILSCAPETVQKFNNLGHKAIHINHGFDPRIQSRIKKENNLLDLSFIGSIIPGKQFHLKRKEFLEQISDQINISIYSPEIRYTGINRLKTFFVRNRSKLKSNICPPVFGLKMFETLLNSKVTLNIHADTSPRYASNMRLFEATGVGCCLVTDWKENLAELFEPDKEVVTYKSLEECLEKIKWLLDHPGEREAIARNGQIKTLQAHTFKERSFQLDKIIQSFLKVK